MAGHNKWTQIKHQKSAADQKRGLLFSKLLNAITVASREEPDPQSNPRLRSLIERARVHGIPRAAIERARQRTPTTDNLAEVLLEAYGPAGIGLLIICITDNRNRTVAEIKHLLTKHGAKMADSGGVRWLFVDEQPKFPLSVDDRDRRGVEEIVQLLESRGDVQRVITNLGGGSS